MHWERDDVGLSRSRAALVEALVGARLVIVDQELLDHSLQVAGAEDEQVIGYLSPARADEPFADRGRPRGPEGQLHDFDAFRTEDLIEAEGELRVAVAAQELGLERPVLKPPGQVPSLLGYPLASRVGGDAGEVDLAAGDLDAEEDVETLKPDRLDREEVTGQHVGGVLADELSPGGLAAAGSRRGALAAQDRSEEHTSELQSHSDLVCRLL